MDALLHFDGISHVIESDLILRPADNVPKEEHDLYEQWKFDNKSMTHLLIGFISTDLVKQFEQLTTTKDIYDCVTEKYDQTSKSHLVEAFSTYVNYKMPEGTSIRDHNDQMSVKYSNLVALRKELDQDFQVMYLLMSFPSLWENVPQTLILQKGVTLSEIEANLIAEGQRQATRSVTLVNYALIARTRKNDGALTVNMKNKKKFKGNQTHKGPKNGVCFNCEELGHFSSRCKKRKGESSGQGKETKEHNRLENPQVRARGGHFPL